MGSKTRVENILYTDRHGNQFRCLVDFGTHDLGATVRLMMIGVGHTNPKRTMNGQGVEVVTFDRETFKPRYSSKRYLHIVGDEYEPPAIFDKKIDISQNEGETIFRHTVRKDASPAKEEGVVSEFAINTYAGNHGYLHDYFNVLNQAIDKLPNSQAKLLFRKRFDQAAFDMGYKQKKSPALQGR